MLERALSLDVHLPTESSQYRGTFLISQIENHVRLIILKNVYFDQPVYFRFEILPLKNHSASKRACLGRSSVGQQ